MPWAEPRQPSIDKIMYAVDAHRAGIIVAKKMAECCLKEAQAWSTSIEALHKAKKEEEAAIQKALVKEKKDAEKRAQKAQAKLEKEAKQQADKEARKAAAAAERPDDNGEGEAKAKTKRRRTGGQEDLSETDPLILHEMSKFTGGSIAFHESLEEFAKAIAAEPGVACCCRLKKASLKKAMLVPWLQPATSQQILDN